MTAPLLPNLRFKPLHAAVLALALAAGAPGIPPGSHADSTGRTTGPVAHVAHVVHSLLPAAHAQSAPQSGRLPDFTQLAEEVGPSVVNIRTTTRAMRGGSGLPDGMDEDMQEFFRRFGFPFPGQPRGRDTPDNGDHSPSGVGSGFILSHDGYIMTNAHVVEGANEVIVTLSDQREFKARIIGADKRTDVAVVKIDTVGLPAVRIGNVNRLKVGEWVMAIGSPFGLENTVTAGIVSAKQRDTGDYLPFIQTDVAINPGNSGGPLLNLHGEVIGINSQIYSRSGGFMGISFAIPIDEAVRVSDQLRASGKVTRGRIGVRIAPVSKEVAESIGLGNKPYGALISGVEAESPAARAGLEAGDVIVKFDGKRIDKMSDLPRLVGNTAPGTRASLTVLRRGQMRDLHITVAEVEPEGATTSSHSPRPDTPPQNGTATAPALGLVVGELTSAQKKALNVSGGVRILAVQEPASQAGLREGDVVLSVANMEVSNVKDFMAALSRADKQRPIHLLVRRGEWAQYVLVRPKAQ